MSKVSEKIGRKCIKRMYWISSGILFVLFFAVAILFAYKSWEWLLPIGAMAVVIWPVITFMYITVVWSWQIENLVNDYKKNDNIISGGFAVLALFTFPFVLSLVFSQWEAYSMLKSFFEGLSNLIIAAMPAFIGLLGVQYSVAVQERNRKVDIKLGAKPFFKVNCCMLELITDEEQQTCHTMRIKIQLTNISQNIGIPLKVLLGDSNNYEVEFSYNPLAHNDTFEKIVDIKSVESFGSAINIMFIYKDVYENLYESKILFVPNEKNDLSKTEVISDEYLQNIKDK